MSGEDFNKDFSNMSSKKGHCQKKLQIADTTTIIQIQSNFCEKNTICFTKISSFVTNIVWERFLIILSR